MSKAAHLRGVGGGLRLRDVRVVDVEHVVADHLLPHAARPLRHLQHKLVQVGADGGPPQAALPQELVLDGRPLFCHILQGVLLPLQGMGSRHSEETHSVFVG